MADKFIITKDGIFEQDFTSEEVAQHDLERQLAEQQIQLDLLVPSQEEIDQAEFELKTITLLQEVGLL